MAMAQAGGGSGARARTTAAAAIPRQPDGKPDLTGVWQRPYVPDMSRNAKDQVGAGALPFTDEGAAIFKAYDPSKFDYTGRCLPQGLTRSMNSPFPMEIFQSPGKVAFLFEAWNVFHVVPIGRPHPKDPDETWAGNSVAQWDGDALVVDTIKFNDKTNMDTLGHPHSDQMHVVERFTRTDATHISYEVTIEDPKIYTRPWKNTRVFTLRPDWEIMEYSCEENNKDLNEGHIK
jgi:hypothetical protein